MNKPNGLLSMILAVCLLMPAFPVSSERTPWDCPECGKTGNTTNFCRDCGHPAPEEAEREKTRLVVWSFSDDFQGMVEKYYAPGHPEIEFVFRNYPVDNNEYTDRINSLLGDPEAAVGDEAPDVFMLEADFVKLYVETDWTGDLKEVGFTDEELASAIPLMARTGRNTGGVQKGLSWQSTPGVLMYRADLAEKYLGVASPEEMQEKVKDWDAFLRTAEELKEKSEGACRMVTGSGDIWKAYRYQCSAGWIVDGRLNIDSELFRFEELCRTMEENGLTHGGSLWSEAWYAGMRGGLETLCYFLPAWGLNYSLKPCCVEGGFYTDPNIPGQTDDDLARLSREKNGTFGDWRIVSGPVPYSWGGTWIVTSAMKAAAADDAKKAAIKDLIYFFTLDTDFLVQYAEDSHDFVGSITAVQKILDNGGTPDPFLGGQDPYAVFASAAALVDDTLIGEFDSTLDLLWEWYVTAPYTSGEQEDLDACLPGFRQAVSDYFGIILD